MTDLAACTGDENNGFAHERIIVVDVASALSAVEGYSRCVLSLPLPSF
jgi:hypothetical protein